MCKQREKKKQTKRKTIVKSNDDKCTQIQKKQTNERRK